MKKNVGNVDRGTRVVLGLVVIALGVVGHSWWGVLGVVPLATAAIGWCPVYLPFGLSTCRAAKR